MKVSIIVMLFLFICAQTSNAQETSVNASTISSTNLEQEIIKLSKDK